jgi:hypothetical protein
MHTLNSGTNEWLQKQSNDRCSTRKVESQAKRTQTADGTAYYNNAATAASIWEMSMDLDTQIGTQNQDENGNRYRYNSIIGESRWME